MSVTSDPRSRLLAGCALFRGLDEGELAALGEAAAEVEFPAGRVIARQGEVGTGFFVIAEGQVRVVRDGETIATLGPGDFFGELSVIDGQPRIAQVVATEPTRCLALATWDFERVLLEHPPVALAILRGLATRLRSVTEQHRH